MMKLVRALAALVLFGAPALAQQFPPTMPPNSFYGRLGIGSGPGQAIPISFLQATLLAGETTVNDANYSLVAADRTIVYTALTASRTVTLLPASAYAAGTKLYVIDRSGSPTSTKTISVAPTGADLINGVNAARAAIYVPFGLVTLESDGLSKWVLGVLPTASRTVLTASQNYWVNGNSGGTALCGPTGSLTCSAGDDNNDCLTFSTACLTANHVRDIVFAKTDLAGFTVAVNLAHCTGSNCSNYMLNCVNGPVVGQSVFGVFGDSLAPAAVKIVPTAGGTGVIAKDLCTVSLNNLAFADNATNNAAGYIQVGVGSYGHVDLQSISFGGCTACTAIESDYAGSITYGDSGSGLTGSVPTFELAKLTGIIDHNTTTFAGSSSLAFSNAFAQITNGGVIYATASTFTGFGSATGSRCNIFGPFSFTNVNPNAIFPGGTDCVPQNFMGAIGLPSGTGAASTYDFGTAGGPLLSGGSSSVKDTWGTRSGNTTVFATTSGTLTSTHVAKFDSSGNIIDGGAPASVPCTGTALSLQYNNAGAFGCISGITSNGTTLTVSGSVAPNVASNGQLSVGSSTTGGGLIEGQGSTSDISLLNKSGSTICSAATGTTTLNCTGLQLGGVAVLTGNQSITLSGDTTGSGATSITTTTGKVNGVTYPAAPSVNTVPVVTSAAGGGTVTYEAVPNAALANSATTVAGQTCTLGSTCGLSTASNALAADVSLTNVGTYFDGPSMAQGSTGTWWATGSVTLTGNGSDVIRCKLHDGTNVKSATQIQVTGANPETSLTLAGTFTSPPGNIRISCRNVTSTTASKIISNDSAQSAASDSTVWGMRIN